MKSSVDNDRQFKLDALRCSQPVNTGETRASVICCEQRRPAIDRAAALGTDWRRLSRQMRHLYAILFRAACNYRSASLLPLVEF